MIDRLFDRKLECAKSEKPRAYPNALPSPAASTRVNNQQSFTWFDADPIKACATSQGLHAKKGVL